MGEDLIWRKSSPEPDPAFQFVFNARQVRLPFGRVNEEAGGLRMLTTSLNLASAKPRNSSSNLSVVTLPDKSGLTTQEAQRRLETVGPNSMPSAALHPLRRMIDKLWAPVPWMLEAAIVLQLVLHKVTEAAVIAFLLFFNAALGFFQEGKAQATLAALKSRLALNASVQRDGAWKVVPFAAVR